MADQPDYERPPGDEAGYLILDEHWHILSADDTGGLTAHIGSTSLVGRPAPDVLGARGLRAPTPGGAANFTPDDAGFLLTSISFQARRSRPPLLCPQAMQE